MKKSYKLNKIILLRKKAGKSASGITLIALIITIIVLLILAGVTISAITGSENSMEKAQQARRENDIGAAKDAASLKATNLIQEFMDRKYVQNDSLNGKTTGQYVAEQMNGKTEGNYKFEVEGTILKVLDAATEDEIVRGTILDNGNIEWNSTGVSNNNNDDNNNNNQGGGEVDSTTRTVIVTSFASLNTDAQLPSDKNTIVQKGTGENQQQIVIPAGFKVGAGTKLEDGMVIKDASETDGNEFVWVPVNQTLTFADSSTGQIELARYIFTDGNTLNYSKAVTANTDNGATPIDTNFTETKDNSVAIKDSNGEIEFIGKTNAAKGYYIGRYEAGYDDENDVTVCKANKQVWCDIERGEITTTNGTTALTGAINEARGMYDEIGFKSDLVNSYAWDTAIVFIEKCGTKTNSSTYAFQGKLTDEGPLDTAEAQDDSSDERDEQCNIFDMAGNVCEWTTEYSSYVNTKGKSCPCVSRGGDFYYNDRFACYRAHELPAYYGGSSGNQGFRPLLYILEI